MKTSAEAVGQIRRRNRSGPWRRISILWRLAIRKLVRAELVEVDSRGNPRVNHIRWTM